MSAFYDVNGKWNTSMGAKRENDGQGKTVAEMLAESAKQQQQTPPTTAGGTTKK